MSTVFPLYGLASNEIMSQRYWYLRAEIKEDFKQLKEDQRWMLTRVDYASEDEAIAARRKLERILGISLKIESEITKSA
jgi:hypothetical protein